MSFNERTSGEISSGTARESIGDKSSGRRERMLSCSVVSGDRTVEPGDAFRMPSNGSPVAVSVAPHVPFIAKMFVAGTIGTAAFRLSFDGGSTWGDLVTTSDTSGGSFVYTVPGTFCVLTFAAGTYVINSTYTVGTDGTITRGGSAINTVTLAASPVDVYDVLLTVVKSGAAGTCIIEPSLDGGESTLPQMAIPSGGAVVLPDTGLVLTLTGRDRKSVV